MWWVCCWVPHRQEISIDSGGAQQQMQTVSRLQLPLKAEHTRYDKNSTDKDPCDSAPFEKFWITTGQMHIQWTELLPSLLLLLHMKLRRHPMQASIIRCLSKPGLIGMVVAGRASRVKIEGMEVGAPPVQIGWRPEDNKDNQMCVIGWIVLLVPANPDKGPLHGCVCMCAAYTTHVPITVTLSRKRCRGSLHSQQQKLSQQGLNGNASSSQWANTEEFKRGPTFEL